MTRKSFLVLISLAACGTTQELHSVGQSGAGVTSADGKIAGICSQSGSDVQSKFASASALEQLVTGRWRICSGADISPAGDGVGYDLTSDGQWYVLKEDSDGNLARGSGFDYQGTWSVISTEAMNGPGVFQLNFNTARGGNGCFPSTETNPNELYLSCDRSDPPTLVYVGEAD